MSNRKDYNEYFERTFREKKIPYLSSLDMESYLSDLSGTQVQGGIIKSKDGKLKINLETGDITYSDASII